jgi:two-component system invasion response regulator UvrY
MIKKKIIIIDDEPLLPSLIQDLLAEEPEFEITEMATEKDRFLELVRKNSFDAALVDISIEQQEGGLDLLRTLKESGFKFPVIILSAHDETRYAFKCLTLGAAGYINKIYICTDLIPGLKKILNGELFVSGHDGETILKKYEEYSNGLKSQNGEKK